MPGTVKNNPRVNATTTNFMQGDPPHRPVLQWQVDDDSDSQFGGVCIGMHARKVTPPSTQFPQFECF